MKKSLLMFAAAAALMFCASAQAGGHGQDKGGFDAGHFVGDNHDKSFEGNSDKDNYQSNGHGNSDFGHSHEDGGYDHHPSPPPVCDPPPVSTVPENPIWSLFLVALLAAAARHTVKKYQGVARFRPRLA